MLTADGCQTDEQLNRASMLLIESRSGGRVGCALVAVRQGGEIQRIDYEPQSPHVGQIRYSAVDLGGLTLSLATQKALHTPGRYEANQCVAHHLADASEWGNQDFPKRAPNRTGVEALARHFLQYGYRRSVSFVAHVKHPTTKRGMIFGMFPTIC